MMYCICFEDGEIIENPCDGFSTAMIEYHSAKVLEVET